MAEGDSRSYVACAEYNNIPAFAMRGSVFLCRRLLSCVCVCVCVCVWERASLVEKEARHSPTSAKSPLTLRAVGSANAAECQPHSCYVWLRWRSPQGVLSCLCCSLARFLSRNPLGLQWAASVVVGGAARYLISLFCLCRARSHSLSLCLQYSLIGIAGA